MGFWHTEAALTVQGDYTPGQIFVLVALGFRACDACGLAWPGVAYLAARTRMPEKRVSAHLSALLKAGLIAVHGYGKGGRGRATEYIVLPQFSKLSTAPCAKCAKHKETPPPATGFRETNPPVSIPETPPPRTPHQKYINQESLSVSEPKSETPPMNPGGSKAHFSADSPESEPIPPEARRFLDSLGVKATTGHPAPEGEPKP